jgi:hypothetical protein
MRLPIDTSGLSFICAGPPSPVTEYETGRAKTDETGKPLYQVPVLAMGDEDHEVISVKVAGEPTGVDKGKSVQVTGLSALPWTMGDRSGVSFKASRIQLAGTGRTETTKAS